MLQALPRQVLLVALIIATGVACGKKSEATKGKDDAGARSNAAPLALPPLGVDRIGRFNFIYGDGAPAYDKALAASKSKAHDWAVVRTGCEAALAKDPSHLDAQRLLATALAQVGEHAAAVDHLVAAIAGDYYKYGPGLADDPDLKDFLATPHGQSVTALAQQIHDEYGRRIKSALWLVGRRSSFKWPAGSGPQPATSRGELYAYDRDTKRFFRLSHTDHQVAGFLRSPSGTEVALLGFDKIERPKTDDAAPLIARAWVAAIDTAEWKPVGPRGALGAARVVSIGYGQGDQLLAASAPSTGRWSIGPWTVSSIDRSTGKLLKVAQDPPAWRLELTLDEGRLVHPQMVDGLEAAWTGDPLTAPTLKAAAGATIQVPESGQAAHETVAVTPDKARIALATAVDPCAKDAAPSLYVADAKTGALKHLLTARSRFTTRWIDATTLAYEDGDGALRLWDATTGRETIRLEDKGGLALDVLSLANAPLCKQAPPTAEPAGSGEEPLPPEEGSGGPVTAPQ